MSAPGKYDHLVEKAVKDAAPLTKEKPVKSGITVNIWAVLAFLIDPNSARCIQVAHMWPERVDISVGAYNAFHEPCSESHAPRDGVRVISLDGD